MHGVHYMPHDVSGKGFHAKVTPMPDRAIIEIVPTSGIAFLHRKNIIVTKDEISIAKGCYDYHTVNSDPKLLDMFRSEATQREALLATLERIESGLQVFLRQESTRDSEFQVLPSPGMIEPIPQVYSTWPVEDQMEQIGKMRLGFADESHMTKLAAAANASTP